MDLDAPDRVDGAIPGNGSDYAFFEQLHARWNTNWTSVGSFRTANNHIALFTGRPFRHSSDLGIFLNYGARAFMRQSSPVSPLPVNRIHKSCQPPPPARRPDRRSRSMSRSSEAGDLPGSLRRDRPRDGPHPQSVRAESSRRFTPISGPIPGRPRDRRARDRGIAMISDVVPWQSGHPTSRGVCSPAPHGAAPR